MPLSAPTCQRDWVLWANPASQKCAVHYSWLRHAGRCKLQKTEARWKHRLGRDPNPPGASTVILLLLPQS